MNEGTIFSISLPPPAPRLTIAPDGGDGYLIDLYGTFNFVYRFQRSPSPAGPWTSRGSQTAPASGLIEFHDLFPPQDRGFYRAVQQ